MLDIQKAMRPFKNERVVAATSVTDMDLRALKYRPISIYLAPNITDITLLKPLLALFVQQTLDMLMLELDHRSQPVFFLLDEFRQLKKMNEITTKLPYVAGYNIKMAFVIQDLKNLDEIYGETSRHSLLGNCGYQLVLGANDQVTAETVSKGLGKRTVRYKTESRTIELMGLHRRTKVEQIRERDLMMPQEIRQMPSEKMVILVEGQNPVFAEKLRYFETAPFKAMEAYSKANVPAVPTTEFLPQRIVPATAGGYGNVAEELHTSVKGMRAVSSHLATPRIQRARPAAAVVQWSQQGNAAKQIDSPIPSVPASRLIAKSRSISPSAIAEIEARFEPAARRLRKLVTRRVKAAGSSLQKNDWSAIFDETVPDEIEPTNANLG